MPVETVKHSLTDIGPKPTIRILQW